MFPEFYQEVVNARGGEDFRDMSTQEQVRDYFVTINKILKDNLKQNETSILALDAQSPSHGNDIPQDDVVLAG